MLSLKYIRENVDLVRHAIQVKGMDADVDTLLSLDKKRRELIQKSDNLKAERNQTSEQIGKLKQQGQDAQEAIKAMRKVADDIKKIDQEVKDCEEKIHKIRIFIPNIPHQSVPEGDETNNKIIKEWGQVTKHDFKIKPHWEIGEKLKLIDFNRGSRLSGTHFVSFTGTGAKLQRALINFMLDMHTEKHGYRETWVPFIVKRDMMFGTGQLPKLEEDMYLVEKDDLFLIPTAEVPVTNLHREEILRGENLPLCYTAYTPCFRREAGSYGAETRGLMRIHQFNKVEMVKFVEPENSYDELELLLKDAEEVIQALELPYRVAILATGDLSFAAAKCYDIEVFAPGVDKWLEISSCSNFTDFQARRMNIRYRKKKGDKLRFVHTLNGSGVALPRLIIAILENFQTDEGTVIVPKALRPYLKMDVID
ncbi:MAG: serine--tRNA ligase [bacterium]